ncbi:hypothetical protein BXZ70DRAFT_693656 [Cristinia sonorae]|uniref:DUF6534 domain-containing protein n=1 Tax=Cristinia sonorae TaxID=1940300 RepID=A0A8K0XJW8_9AGAR|nr:hypothetical protein BXZ70DRAFT_693656 [Cristinia sonorae]
MHDGLFSPLLWPVLVGHIATWGLMGMLTIQICIYFVAFPNDHWEAKSVVGVTYFLEVIQLGCATYDIFDISVRECEPGLLSSDTTLLWLDVVLLPSIIATACQVFYAWRISGLSQRYELSAVICLISASQLGLSIWDIVHTLDVADLSVVAYPIDRKPFLAWLTTIAICDIVITGSMSYYVWIASNTTRHRPTKAILKRLMKLTIETGLITTAAATIVLVVPSDVVFKLLLGPMSKLYSNTLLAVLNSRLRISGGRVRNTDAATINISFSTLQFTRASHRTEPTALVQERPNGVAETDIEKNNNEVDSQHSPRILATRTLQNLELQQS